MSLPPFDQRGLFPDGVYPATQSELRDRCVAEFPNSGRRPLVFDGLVRYQTAIATLGLNITQWVDGFFVDRTRLNPDDVDVVNFCNGDVLNALPPDIQNQIDPLLDARRDTEAEYHIHSFMVAAFPNGHPYASSFEANRKYWRETWAKPQDYTGSQKKLAPWRGKKGFVVMKVGDVKLCPDISEAP